MSDRPTDSWSWGGTPQDPSSKAPFTPPLERMREEERSAPWADRAEDYFRMLSEARMVLLMDHPFFGRLAMKLRFALSSEVQTAAIRADAVCIFNPGFLDSLDVAERAFVIAHEVCHLIYFHFDRVQGRDFRLWNMAGDYVINPILVRAGLKMRSGPDLRPLYDPRFETLSDEQVYEHLRAEVKILVVFLDSLRGGMGTPLGDCDFGATGRLRERNEPILDPWEWREEILAAARAARARGDFPAGLELLIDELREPTLPWSVLLTRMLPSFLRAGSSYRRPARRSPALRRVMAEKGLRTVLPGPGLDRRPVVVAVDTSGSMSAEDLKAAFSEVWGILRVYKRPIRVLLCDTEVHVDADIRDVQSIPVRGGGGTDTAPVFRRVSEVPGQTGPPAALIYFSDLYADFPSEPPPYPVIWVQTDGTETREVPFGQVVVLDTRRV